MIAKHHRFHGLGSLRFIFNRGEVLRAPHCSLRYRLNERQQSFRVAVVVSKKVHKNAVVRNRIRRRIYEIVRGVQDEIISPYDLVISVYSDQLLEMTPGELTATITGLFKKAGVIKTKHSSELL